MPLPEHVSLELDVIDASLRGEAVDPEFAELAELALLLADSRPELSAAGATELDRRFNGLSAPVVPPRRRRPWFLRPAFGAGLAVAVALGAAVVVLPLGGGSSSNSKANFNSFSPSSVSSSSASGSSSAPSTASHSSSGSAGSAQSLTAVPTPQSNGRRIVQSSQLSLTAPSSRLATVSQELFNAVGAEQGIVKHSQVSTGAGGLASFTLSIPTQNLSATLSRLAQLRYASVASSTATTSDVNSQYLDDQRALADAKALRRSLLTQLQAATTTAAIDSLKTQIQGAESTIAADEKTLDSLQSRISYSAVNVQINASNNVVTPGSGGGGFTFKKAGHDALRVLVVAAGVALIILAVLIPVGLVAALVAWLAFGWRRQRRERALDAA
jgi:hypothetical protein